MTTRENDAYVNRTFVTPSGRRWKPGHSWGGRVYMVPLGDDTHGFGGVKGRYVDPARLDGNDRTWKLHAR